jgi:hypothetical protein
MGAVLAGCASATTRAAAVPSASASAVVAPSVIATPSASPSPTPTPTASATPFVSSADEAGAHAFVVAYFAELDRAYATGDVSRLKPYRLDTCICVRLERRIAGVYAQGGHITGASLQVLGWAYGAHGPAYARTAIYFHSTAISHVIPGRPTETDPALKGYYAVDLRRDRTHWVISDIRFKKAS